MGGNLTSKLYFPLYAENITECSKPPGRGEQDPSGGEISSFRSHGQRPEDAQ